MYNMKIKMMLIMKETDEANDWFIRDCRTPMQFLDVCCAPGGFSEYVLENKQARGFGITLPEHMGGHKFDHGEQLANAERYHLTPIDVTMHATTFYCHPDDGRPPKARVDTLEDDADKLGGACDLVILDGSFLGGKDHIHKATNLSDDCNPVFNTWFSEKEAHMSLLVAQLIVAANNLKPGGNLVLRLSNVRPGMPHCYHTEAFICMLRRMFGGSMRPFKPRSAHLFRDSYYLVCKKFKPEVAQLIKFVPRLTFLLEELRKKHPAPASLPFPDLPEGCPDAMHMVWGDALRAYHRPIDSFIRMMKEALEDYNQRFEAQKARLRELADMNDNWAQDYRIGLFVEMCPDKMRTTFCRQELKCLRAHTFDELNHKAWGALTLNFKSMSYPNHAIALGPGFSTYQNAHQDWLKLLDKQDSDSSEDIPYFQRQRQRGSAVEDDASSAPPARALPPAPEASPTQTAEVAGPAALGPQRTGGVVGPPLQAPQHTAAVAGPALLTPLHTATTVDPAPLAPLHITNAANRVQLPPQRAAATAGQPPLRSTPTAEPAAPLQPLPPPPPLPTGQPPARLPPALQQTWQAAPSQPTVQQFAQVAMHQPMQPTLQQAAAPAMLQPNQPAAQYAAGLAVHHHPHWPQSLQPQLPPPPPLPQYGSACPPDEPPSPSFRSTASRVGTRQRLSGPPSDPRPHDGSVFDPQQHLDGSASDPWQHDGSSSDPRQRDGSLTDPRQRQSSSDPLLRDAPTFDPRQWDGSLSDPRQRHGSLSDPRQRHGSIFDPRRRDGALDPRQHVGSPLDQRHKPESPFVSQQLDRPEVQVQQVDRPSFQPQQFNRPAHAPQQYNGPSFERHQSGRQPSQQRSPSPHSYNWQRQPQHVPPPQQLPQQHPPARDEVDTWDY